MIAIEQAPHKASKATVAMFVFAGVLSLTPLASPALALAAGVVLAISFGSPLGKIGQQVSKQLLQGCVILLGFGMNLPFVLKAGMGGAIFAAGTIGLTLGAGYLLGRLLHMRRAISALISAGTAICGGSAIAAVGSTIEASQADMTVALGSVFLLNGIALYLFPFLGHALHLSQHQFGMWAGVSIHDISSVVGAADRYGPEALRTATAVKLSRSLWIVPVTLVMAMMIDRGSAGRAGVVQAKAKRITVPWFIGLFVVASLSRSLVPAVTLAAPTLQHIATSGLCVALFLIGSAMSLESLKAVGWRAIAQAAGLWVLISSVSLLVILRM